jgi:hypothetical protein
MQTASPFRRVELQGGLLIRAEWVVIRELLKRG